MAKKHYIKSDKELNSALKEEVSELRGGIVEQANKAEIPDTFEVEPHPEKPSMIITNKENGKQTEVSLFAYREVRKALNNLF